MWTKKMQITRAMRAKTSFKTIVELKTTTEQAGKFKIANKMQQIFFLDSYGQHCEVINQRLPKQTCANKQKSHK